MNVVTQLLQASSTKRRYLGRPHSDCAVARSPSDLEVSFEENFELIQSPLCPQPRHWSTHKRRFVKGSSFASKSVQNAYINPSHNLRVANGVAWRDILNFLANDPKLSSVGWSACPHHMLLTEVARWGGPSPKQWRGDLAEPTMLRIIKLFGG